MTIIIVFCCAFMVLVQMPYLREIIIPCTQTVVAGWNDHVREQHDIARAAYLDWIYLVKPHNGPTFWWMKKTIAKFKLALRYCKQHRDGITAHAAASLSTKDYNAF